MDATTPLAFHLFDRDADLHISERRLPHWSQPGAVCFIIWRTIDSMPKAVVAAWSADRSRWLASHGIDPDAPDWRDRLQRLDPAAVDEFLQTFWNRWHD